MTDVPKSKKEREALLSPPTIQLEPPPLQITHAPMSHPLITRVAKRQEQDSMTRYELAIQAESFRLQSRLHELQIQSNSEQPVLFSYQEAALRKTIQTNHGRALIAHETGLGEYQGIAGIVAEYILRGNVSRALFLAPGHVLPFWDSLLNAHLHTSFTLSHQLPQEGEPIPPLLLLDEACFQEDLPDWFKEQAKYQLIVVSPAEHLKKRRSRPWRNCLALSPDKMLLRTRVPFEEKPAELHGYMALLGVPELPPAARLKRELGDAEQPITPDVRRILRPLLQHVTLRNTHPTTPIEWAPKLWKTRDIPRQPGYQKLIKPITQWLEQQLPTPPEEEENLHNSPTHKQLLPLLAAMGSATCEAALTELSQHPDWTDHTQQLQEWAKEASLLNKQDTRITAIQQIGREHPNLRILVFCQHALTCQRLYESFDGETRVILSAHGKTPVFHQKAPSPDEPAIFLVSDQSIPSLYQGPFDLVVHFDFPWNPEILDLRSNWLLHQQAGKTRQVHFLLPEASPEEHVVEQLLFRLKPEELPPEDFGTICRNLVPEWQLPAARWKLLSTTATAFGEGLSKPLMEANKQFRRTRDLNQRLFLDDYAL